MTLYTAHLSACKFCGLRFLPATWLSHRVLGFCKKECELQHTKEVAQ